MCAHPWSDSAMHGQQQQDVIDRFELEMVERKSCRCIMTHHIWQALLVVRGLSIRPGWAVSRQLPDTGC